MIFVVVEQPMNGTVTMSTQTFGIEANSFEQAVDVLQKIIHEKHPSIEVNHDSGMYLIPGTYPTHGQLHRAPLNILNKKES